MGDIRFKDINGDGKVFPDFTYGLALSVSYKNLTLQAHLSGVQGFDRYMLSGTYATDMFNSEPNMEADYILDRFHPVKNPNGKYPRVAMGDPGRNQTLSDFWLIDASYLSIKNVSLSYSVPSTFAAKLGMNAMNVYLGSQNLYTFGKYTPNEPFTYTDYEYVDGKEVGTSVTLNTGDDVLYDYKWSPTGFNVKKLTEDLTGLTNVRYAGLDWPAMRMADLYLILAEALAMQNKDEALVWVNKVRARASVNMPPRTTANGSLMDLVKHERRVELAMEGQRLFDLFRWDALKDVFGDGHKVKLHYNSDYLPMSSSDKFKTVPGLAKYPSNHILFPIPQDELDRNSAITGNNPGY